MSRLLLECRHDLERARAAADRITRCIAFAHARGTLGVWTTLRDW
jgi:hypothetical protein